MAYGEPSKRVGCDDCCRNLNIELADKCGARAPSRVLGFPVSERRRERTIRRLRVEPRKKGSANLHRVSSDAGFDAQRTGGLMHRSRFAVEGPQTQRHVLKTLVLWGSTRDDLQQGAQSCGFFVEHTGTRLDNCRICLDMYSGCACWSVGRKRRWHPRRHGAAPTRPFRDLPPHAIHLDRGGSLGGTVSDRGRRVGFRACLQDGQVESFVVAVQATRKRRQAPQRKRRIWASAFRSALQTLDDLSRWFKRNPSPNVSRFVVSRVSRTCCCFSASYLLICCCRDPPYCLLLTLVSVLTCRLRLSLCLRAVTWLSCFHGVLGDVHVRAVWRAPCTDIVVYCSVLPFPWRLRPFEHDEHESDGERCLVSERSSSWRLGHAEAEENEAAWSIRHRRVRGP